MLAFCRRKQRAFTAVMIVGVLFGVFAFMVPAASAAQEDYGAWFPNNGKATSYQADVAPFNDSNVSEITSFACVLNNGEPIDDKEKTMISTIFGVAGKIFQGNWDITSGNQYGFNGLTVSDDELTQLEQNASQGASTHKSTLDNGGYPSGTEGMDAFLRTEKDLLQGGNWVQMSARDIHSEQNFSPWDYRLPNGVVVNVNHDKKGEAGTIEEQRAVARLLDTSARHPLELTKGLPQGCTLASMTPPSPSFGGLFSNTGDTITNLLLYVPGKLASTGYDFISPYAFKYTFWTPHSERGDVMWNIPDSCNPATSGYSQQQTADACLGGSGGTPLGYAKSNKDVASQSSWYLQIARFMQWLISGTYFLILFTAATLFIFRGNRTQNMNLMRLFPRLLLSIILTLFSGFAIGAVISMSNLLVQSIFGENGVWTVGGVNEYLAQAGNIVGTGSTTAASGVINGSTSTGTSSDFLSQVVQIVVGVCCIYYFTIFAVGSLLRQLILIALIVLAPVAIFCLVNERWRHHFDRWVRCLLAVCFTPVILALIFKLGMSINPLVLHPVSSYGTLGGTLGLIMMLATLWAMTRVIKSASRYVVAHSGVGLAMQSAGGRISRSGGLLSAVDPRIGLAAAVTGGALAAKGAGIERSGSLIPGSRAMGAGSGSPAGGYAGSTAAAAAGLAASGSGASGGGASKGASAAAPAGLLAAGATAMGRRVGGDVAGDQMSQWMQKRQQKALAKKGISEITQSEYMRKLATAEAARRAGRDPIAAIGGEVYEDGNQYFFKDAGTGVDGAHGGRDWQPASDAPVGALPAGGTDSPVPTAEATGQEAASPDTATDQGTGNAARESVEIPHQAAPLTAQPVPSSSGGAPPVSNPDPPQAPRPDAAAGPSGPPPQIEVPPVRSTRDPARQAEMQNALKQAATASNRRSAADRVRESAQDLSGFKGTAANVPPTSNAGAPALPPQQAPAPQSPPNPTPPGPPPQTSRASTPPSSRP